MTNPDDLAARFTAGTLPKDEWTHHVHLVVGAWHVHEYGPDLALDRLRDGIRRLNDSHGTVNSATSGYHETVTAAYVRVLAAYLADCPPDMPFDECAARLIASPFVDKNLLLTFYSREMLFSTRARAQWVEPDVAPLPQAVAPRGG